MCDEISEASASTRAPTVALEVSDPEEAARRLAERGILCGASDFYATRPLAALGLAGRSVLRLSFTHYTSDAEMAQLLGALDEVL